MDDPAIPPVNTEEVQPMEVDELAGSGIATPQAVRQPQESPQHQDISVTEDASNQNTPGDGQAAPGETGEISVAGEPNPELEKEGTAALKIASPDLTVEAEDGPGVSSEVPSAAQEPNAESEMAMTDRLDQALPDVGDRPTAPEDPSATEEPSPDVNMEGTANPEVTLPDVAGDGQAMPADMTPAQQLNPEFDQQATSAPQHASTELAEDGNAEASGPEVSASGNREEIEETVVTENGTQEQPPTQNNDESATSADSTPADSLLRSRSNIDSLQVLAALNNALAYRETHETDEAQDTVLVPPRSSGRATVPFSAGSSYSQESILTSLGPQDGLLSGRSEGFNLNSASFDETASDSSKFLDTDGLADYSIPESRFAGVFLDIVPDRRKLRGYIPSEEVKKSLSLKVTIKKPEGWAPRATQAIEAPQSQQADTSSGRRSGRTRKPAVQEEIYETPPRKRRARQRVAASEQSFHQEEPNAQSQKASQSPEFTLPADEEDIQDRDISDGTDYQEEELVEETKKRRKSESMQPTRKSGRVAEQGKRAHWNMVDEDDEVSL